MDTFVNTGLISKKRVKKRSVSMPYTVFQSLEKMSSTPVADAEKSPLTPIAIFAYMRTPTHIYTYKKFEMDFIKKIVDKNGPDITDHQNLKTEIERIGSLLEKNTNAVQHQKLLDIIAPTLTPKTVQGFAFQKPHGYAGDFEIIDKIYTEFKSDDDKFRRWDEFFHAQEAARAVRNRKTFFLNTLKSFTKHNDVIKVLNVGSGPGRDIFEYFKINPQSSIHFECVDNDRKAINYASNLCAEYLNQITFTNKNVFKFNSSKKYDLIWSAGLFDYLNDKLFIFLLKRLYSFLKPGGYLYVGNFSDYNPTRKYMEIFGDWHLIHRSRSKLYDLAILAGINPMDINILTEPLGINLFLQILKPEADSSH
jgi:extracellular factor (EF) 3-hydroxypalmitic acid methyl ester biosynthesis protein